MELALYEPGLGFYTESRSRGPRTDFMTAPEISPLFGCFIGTHAVRLWRRTAEPPVLRIVELGGSSGTLARQMACFFGFECQSDGGRPPIGGPLVALIREALGVEVPSSPPAVSYVIVDPSLEGQSAFGAFDLSAETAALASEFTLSSVPDLAQIAAGGTPGERCTLVVANEVFDNIPSHLLVRDRNGVGEFCVSTRDGRLVLEARAPTLAETDLDTAIGWSAVRDLPSDFSERMSGDSLAGFSSEAEIGVASPQQVRLATQAASSIEPGGVLILDLSENPWGVPVVAYRGHRQLFDPLADPGEYDIMVPVQWEGIRSALLGIGFATPSLVSQARWLADNGLSSLYEVLMEALSRPPESSRPQRGIAALEARSLAVSAKALSDPAALGGFAVLESTRI